MYINTRARALTITTLVTILFSLFQIKYFDIHIFDSSLINIVIESLIIGSAVFLGIYWVVEFKLRYMRFFTVALFPAFFAMIFNIFVGLSLYSSIVSIKGGLLTTLLVIVFTFTLYFLILNANILNVSSLTGIPLERAAKTAQYIFSLIYCYLITFVLFSLQLPAVIRLPLLIATLFYLTYQTFWSSLSSISELFSVTSILTLLMVIWVLTISMWPLTPAFVALLFTTILYITYGVGLDKLGKISTLSRIEYVLVLFLVCTFCILTSNWGINGRII